VAGEVKGVDSRAGSVGGRTIATIRSQFHKTPRGNSVAPTNGPVHTRKRACKVKGGAQGLRSAPANAMRRTERRIFE